MAILQTQTTDASGEVQFTDIPVGTGYTLETLVATIPDGYQAYIDSDFEVEENMPETLIGLEPEAGNDLTLDVKVVNGLISLLPVSGAVFNVFADAGKTQLLGQFTSDSSGEFSIPHLVGSTAGRSYYISQVTAPTGYYPASDQTVVILKATTPDELVIVNPFLIGFDAKVSDANYSNMTFEGVDVQISK